MLSHGLWVLRQRGDVSWGKPGVHSNRGAVHGRWRHAAHALLDKDRRAVFMFGGETSDGLGLH